MIKFTVMQNFPGCIPEQDPDIYDAMWDAVQAYRDRLRYATDNIEGDAEFLLVDTELHRQGTDAILAALVEHKYHSMTIDGTVYSITTTTEEA